MVPARNKTLSTHAFPTKPLTVSLFVTIGLFVILGGLSWYTYKDFKTAQIRDLRLQELSGIIIHLDEVLTMSARMAAATGNLAWAERYQRFLPQLEAAIKEAKSIAPETFMSEAAARTEAANLKLIEMEQQAFSLVRDGDLDRAALLLSSENYEAQKRRYSEGMRQITSGLSNRLHETLRRYRRQYVIALIVAVIALPVLLLLALGALGMIKKNIRERNETEQALRESEKRYRDLYDNAPDMFASVDAKTKTITQCNQTMADALGYHKEEILGRSVYDLYHSDCMEEARRFGGGFISKGELHDAALQLKRKDGSKIDVSLNITAVRDKQGNIISGRSIWRDITQRKQAERQLRESETKYRELADSLPQIVFETDAKGKLTFANRNAFELFGHTQDDFKRGLNALEMLIPEDRNRARENMQRILRRGNLGGIEYRALRKDGSTFPVVIHANAVIRESNPVGLRGIIIDLTARKQAEEALQQSEKRYRSLVENTLDGYFISEIPSGKVIFLNQRICDLFGYTLKEGLELSVWDVVYPEDHERMREHIRSQIDGKRAPSEALISDVIKKDKTNFRAEVSTSVITYLGKPVVQGVLRDVTEKERLQQQLFQAQKIEAIGTLAGGIAHDFNNLLMGIQGNASLMLLDINQRHAHYEKLKNIERYVTSGADLSKQLLGFARGGKYEVRPANLNDLISKNSEMFHRARKEIIIHENYQDELWLVDVDEGQIEQVLINLYVNAWQAMPDGGDLYLRTENVVLDEFYVKPHDIEPGKYVKVSVTDTGVGMDKATQERIFDPFFTTKERSRGTGLGLASAYGIIKNHGGVISVYSEIGHGATFSFYLPASQGVIVEEREIFQEIVRGTETILLVDDEEMIVDVNKALIERLGYTVIVANSGKEAVEVYNSHRNNIDMVILDMIMPDMAGGATYDRLREINPVIKVLLSSGYSLNGQATDILKRGCNGFIQKPFNMKELSQKLREILDKEEA